MNDPGVNPPPSEAMREVVSAALDVRRAVMRRTGLNETELGALELLADTPSSPGEVARHLGVSTAASTGVVDRLERRGHVQRRPHATDRRRTEVSVTPSGFAELQHQIRPMVVALHELEERLSEQERQVVIDYLMGVKAAFAKVINADDQ